MLLKKKLNQKNIFVGGIDFVDSHSIKGWVYNSQQPAQPILLDVAIDNIIAAKIVASHHRPDCNTDIRIGCMGFDVKVNFSGAAGRSMSLHCSDKPSLFFGPFIIAGKDHDHWPSDAVGRAQHIFEHVTATHEENMRKSQHIFDHVTATHEENMRKSQHIFDHVTATHEHTLNAIASQVSDTRQLSVRSEFLGIGSCTSTENSDTVERELFKARLEQEILMNHQKLS